jgi:hypothetical protein
MELLLNLAWVLLATIMVSLWLRFSPRNIGDRRVQLVALGLLLFILLPAISMTDDLLAAQSAVEVDCCLRRDHECSSHPGHFPVVAALTLVFGGLTYSVGHLIVSRTPARVFGAPPALAGIENRPPPAA